MLLAPLSLIPRKCFFSRTNAALAKYRVLKVCTVTMCVRLMTVNRSNCTGGAFALLKVVNAAS